MDVSVICMNMDGVMFLFAIMTCQLWAEPGKITMLNFMYTDLSMICLRYPLNFNNLVESDAKQT